jgi:hypothetical protein
MKKSNNLIFNLAILGVLASWICFGIFFLAPFGFLTWVGILVYLISQKSFSFFYITLSAWLLVPTISFLMGVHGYTSGTGVIKSVGGGTRQRFLSIDEETRLPIQPSGCILVGFELFTFLPNNTALTLCTNLFGFQRGTYQGNLVTEEQTFQLIAKADTFTTSLANDYYVIKSKIEDVKIPYYQIDDNVISPFPVRGVFLGKNGFLFQSVNTDSDNNDPPKLYLLDIQNHTIIKSYSKSF